MLRLILCVLYVGCLVLTVSCTSESTGESTGEARCENCDPGDDGSALAADATMTQFGIAHPGETALTGVFCTAQPGGYWCLVSLDLVGNRDFRCEVTVQGRAVVLSYCANCTTTSGNTVCVFI